MYHLLLSNLFDQSTKQVSHTFDQLIVIDLTFFHSEVRASMFSLVVHVYMYDTWKCKQVQPVNTEHFDKEYPCRSIEKKQKYM